MFSAYSEL